MTVYATTDIAAGEEINIEYQPGLIQLGKGQRRVQLYSAFGFQCACAACDQPPDQVMASDSRRAEINSLVSKLAEAGAQKRRGEVTAGLQRMRELLQAEGYKASASLDSFICTQSSLKKANTMVVPEFNDANVSKAFAFWSSMPREGS